MTIAATRVEEMKVVIEIEVVIVRAVEFLRQEEVEVEVE